MKITDFKKINHVYIHYPLLYIHGKAKTQFIKSKNDKNLNKMVTKGKSKKDKNINVIKNGFLWQNPFKRDTNTFGILHDISKLILATGRCFIKSSTHVKE